MVETFFTEKRIIKKIIIAIVFIFLFNFTFSYLGNNVVFAETVQEQEGKKSEDRELEEGGGKLLIPIQSFVLFLADSILQLMQTNFLIDLPILVDAQSEELGNGELIIWGIVTIGVGVAAILGTIFIPLPEEAVTWPAFLSCLGKLGITVTQAATAGFQLMAAIGVAGVVGGTVLTVQGCNNLEGKFKLPTIYYSPAIIFSNGVPMFDINFFNPGEEEYEITNVVNTKQTEEKIGGTNRAIGDNGIDDIYTESVGRVLKLAGYEEAENTSDIKSIIDNVCNSPNFEFPLAKNTPTFEVNGRTYYVFMMQTPHKPYGTNTIQVYYFDQDYNYNYIYEETHSTVEEGTTAFKNWAYSAEEFKTSDSGNSELTEKKQEYKNLLKQKMEILQEKGKNSETVFVENFEYEGVSLKLSYQYTTSQGILYLDNASEQKTTSTYESSAKILQSTVSSMYKTLRTVAIVALLTILVYVGIRMVLSSASKDKAKYKQMLVDWLVAFILLFVLHYLMAFIIDISESLTNICNKNCTEVLNFEIPPNTKIYDPDSDEYIAIQEPSWETNIVGYFRFFAGLIRYQGYTIKAIAYTIIYVVMVIYLIVFSWQYMKRVLYIAFLTMIAPLVAITYPLDKINDGKAQGFNMWIKEYIFNALLQPIHYIIYVIIMGSAMTLAAEHPIYALVAIGFMVPAEKFIRKMFGFEKASTVGTFGAAAGAAALMGGLQKLRHNPHGKKNDDNGAKGDKDDPNGRVRTISAMPDGPNNPGGGNDGLPGGSNNPRPGDPGFIGPLPYDRNSTLLGMPQTTNTPSGNNHNWDSRLTEEQIDYAREKGIDEPTGPEYEQFLGELGYRRNPQTENRWDSRLTEEQIDYAREKGIDEPKGPEYEQFLGELGYGRSSSTSGTVTPTPQPRPQPQPRPNPEPTVYATPRPRPTPSTGTRRNIYNKPGGFINGVRAVGGHYKRRLDNRLRKAHPLRALRRGLTFGAGALTLGTIGLAAGIASGDPSKALQYTVAGGAAGGYLGRNIGETASNIVGLEGAAKSFKAGALGDEYDKLERAKYKRDFKNNVSNYDVGVRSVGVDGWKDMSKDGGIIDTGIDYGINNVNDLGNIYKAKEEFKNQYDMTDEEAQDWAFKAYKLDQNFGDWSKNSKTRENLDKLLKAKGYTDDTQREDVTKRMVETMGVYQNVALDKEIEEIKPDYSRITRQTEDSNIPNENEREYQDDYRDNRQPEIPIQQTATVNEQEETARRANAESEANKAAVRQKEENRKIQEELEARAKADKKAERRARAETARQRSEQAKAKRKGMETKNGELGNPKASNAIDPDRRVVKPKTKDVNPISSDPGNNGNGPINTL